jgi:hypothetical protein
MKRVSLVLLVVLVVAAFVPAQAQFKLAIGGGMGLNLNLHGGSDLPQSGSGVGFAIAGQADMSFNKNVGLLFSMYFYDNRSGSYSMSQNYYGTNYTTDVSASIAYFELEPLFKYTLPSAPVYLIIGPSLGFSVQNSYETKTTGYASQKGTIQDMNTRFELKAGGGYVYPLARDMRLNGQLTFGYGLTNVQNNVNWKVMSFGLLTSFEYDIVK